MFDFLNPKKRAIKRSVQAGTSKALRDVRLVDQFMKEHDGNPAPDVAERFFKSLDRDNDVNRDDEREIFAYAVIVRAYQENLARQRGVDVMDIFSSRAYDRDRSVEVRVVDLGSEDISPERLAEHIVEQLGDVDPSILGKIVDQVKSAAQDQFRDNLEAGYCLGCGGSLSENGGCMGDGDPDWDGTPPVSETAAEKLARELASLSPQEKLNKITGLMARLDQLKASAHDQGGELMPNEVVELENISTELNALLVDAGMPTMDEQE